MNIQQFWESILAQDEQKIRTYFHPKAYVNWHCTNEHFSVEEFIQANCEYPGEWGGEVERKAIHDGYAVKGIVKSLLPQDITQSPSPKL